VSRRVGHAARMRRQACGRAHTPRCARCMLVTPARSRGIRYACVGHLPIWRRPGDPATDASKRQADRHPV